ncbi:MAG TPA: hypothetical protein VFS21_02630 [Roseiflexaceae bacterium]|nr:hypothetical protein [Roseiflexaceae bacterium]
MSHLLDILQADFTELRAEQRDRMSRRDNQVYVALGVSGGAIAFGLTSGPQVAMLATLGLPLALFALGLLVISDDRRVSEIDDCIRQELAPAIERELERLHPALLPEERLAILPWYRGWRKQFAGRVRRKMLRLLMMLLVFSGAGLAGPMLYWLLVPPGLLHAVAALGMVLMALLTAEIAISAEVLPAKRRERHGR